MYLNGVLEGWLGFTGSVDIETDRYENSLEISSFLNDKERKKVTKKLSFFAKEDVKIFVRIEVDNSAFLKIVGIEMLAKGKDLKIAE